MPRRFSSGRTTSGPLLWCVAPRWPPRAAPPIGSPSMHAYPAHARSHGVVPSRGLSEARALGPRSKYLTDCFVGQVERFARNSRTPVPCCARGAGPGANRWEVDRHADLARGLTPRRPYAIFSPVFARFRVRKARTGGPRGVTIPSTLVCFWPRVVGIPAAMSARLPVP